MIRHAADVPVLLSAIASRPDWLLTHNTKHFTQTVARRAGLRIATLVEFFRALSKSLSDQRLQVNPPSPGSHKNAEKQSARRYSFFALPGRLLRRTLRRCRR